MKKRIILKHYLIAALWAEELDSREIDEILPASIIQAQKDIKLFVDTNKNLLKQSKLSEEQIGHDFWLTRNHHGTGIWDRDLEKNISKQLTDACEKFTELNVFGEGEEIIIE